MTTNVTLNNEVFKVTVADALGLTGPQGQIGPSGPSGNAQNVTTVSAFQAASFDANTQVVNIQGYTTVGVGGFRVRRATSQPAHAWRFRSVDRYLPSGSTDAANGGWWEGCPDQVVTPYQFGAVGYTGVGSPTADDYAPLQAFFTYINANRVDVAVVTGQFGIKTPLVYDCANLVDNVTSVVHFEASLYDISTSGLSNILTIQNSTYQVWTGHLYGYGVGSSTYSTRKTLDIFVFGSNNNHFQPCYMFAYAALRWGFDIQDLNSELDCSYLDAAYCGLANGTSAFITTISAVTNSGAGLSARSAITLAAAIPSHVTADNCVVNVGATGGSGGVAGYVYTVTDTTHISIYPQIDAVTSIGSDIYIIYGGGVKLRGNDSSICNLRFVRALQCGVGLWNGALYPANVGNLVAHNNGVEYIHSASPTSSAPTGNIGHMYAESNVWNFLAVNVNGASVNIAKMNDDASLSKFTSISGISSPIFGLSISNWRGFPVGSTDGQFTTAANIGLATAANPMPVTVKNRDTATITLFADSDIARIFGNVGYILMAVGSGGNGAPAGVYTFALDSSISGTWKINGGTIGASQSFSGFRSATAFVLHWDYSASNITIGACSEFTGTTLNQKTGTGSVTLTAAVMVSGEPHVTVEMTSALGAPGTLVTDTAANLIAAKPFWVVGKSYRLRILHSQADANNWTLTGGTGVTIHGTATIVPSAWREWDVYYTGAGAVDLYNAGSGTS